MRFTVVVAAVLLVAGEAQGCDPTNVNCGGVNIEHVKNLWLHIGCGSSARGKSMNCHELASKARRRARSAKGGRPERVPDPEDTAVSEAPSPSDSSSGSSEESDDDASEESSTSSVIEVPNKAAQTVHFEQLPPADDSILVGARIKKTRNGDITIDQLSEIKGHGGDKPAIDTKLIADIDSKIEQSAVKVREGYAGLEAILLQAKEALRNRLCRESQSTRTRKSRASPLKTKAPSRKLKNQGKPEKTKKIKKRKSRRHEPIPGL